MQIEKSKKKKEGKTCEEREREKTHSGRGFFRRRGSCLHIDVICILGYPPEMPTCVHTADWNDSDTHALHSRVREKTSLTAPQVPWRSTSSFLLRVFVFS